MKNSIRNGIGAMIALGLNVGCSWQDAARVGMFAVGQAANEHRNEKTRNIYSQEQEKTRQENAEGDRAILAELRELRREIRASKRESDGGTYNPDPRKVRTINFYTSDSPWVDKNRDGNVNWGEGGFSKEFGRGEEIYIHGRGDYRKGEELVIRVFDFDGRMVYKTKHEFLETKTTNFSEKIPTNSFPRGTYDLVMQIGDSRPREQEIKVTNERIASSR